MCDVHVQWICKIISTKSSKLTIHENLDPQKLELCGTSLCVWGLELCLHSYMAVFLSCHMRAHETAWELGLLTDSEEWQPLLLATSLAKPDPSAHTGRPAGYMHVCVLLSGTRETAELAYQPTQCSLIPRPHLRERVWWHPADTLGFITFWKEISNHIAEKTKTKPEILGCFSMMTQHFFWCVN